MTELARQLALSGAVVHYVAEESMSEERRAMGWNAGELTGVRVHHIDSADDAIRLAAELPSHAVHITQGVRSNGLVTQAQNCIIELGLRHYVIMETVDQRGFLGWIKPFVYAFRFWSLSRSLEGILAIGERTPAWIRAWSPKSMRVIPFAYFLEGRKLRPYASAPAFRFIFVGGLIHRKRIDLLLESLSGLMDSRFDLEIIGDGPLRRPLERQANELLPGRVNFLGPLPMEAAIDRIASADCLVLPSDHDGWGAVVSEAQIYGTPVVCSAGCGSSVTVRASGFGAVFRTKSVVSLRESLSAMLASGRTDPQRRKRLSDWAACLTAEAGAAYLLEIVGSDTSPDEPVKTPWQRASSAGVSI